MTKEKFTFQVDLSARRPIIVCGLTITQTVLLRQEENRIFFEKDKIDIVIQTLQECKRWLNSP